MTGTTVPTADADRKLDSGRLGDAGTTYVHALRWLIDMVLRETGVSSKVRRIVQAIFAAATGVVRIRQQDGGIVRDVCYRGYPLAGVPLHRWARSYLQTKRSCEPWHDSRNGCAHRSYVEV